jgi:triacylglycerol lipase
MKRKPTKHNKEVESGRESVILIHGLARRSCCMRPLARALEKKGYKVVNLDYPSAHLSVEAISKRFLHPVVQEAIGKSRVVHFVTHSMGGIIVRRYLGQYTVERLGRVVMLAPPNQGSELVDHFKNTFFFKKLLGPAGGQLSTAADALPSRLGPAAFELGVIAGSLSFNPLSSWLFDGVNDGKVALSRTMLAGMQDMFVVRCNHTFIMRSRRVIEQTTIFLETGCFSRKTSAIGAACGIQGSAIKRAI